MLAQSDQLLEDIFDLINTKKDERERADLARIGKLAIEYRMQQNTRRRTQAAIERHAAERRALRASICHDDGSVNRSTPGAVLQRAGAGEGDAR